MRKVLVILVLALASAAWAQVAVAEVLDVADTLPRSPGISALLRDQSVGEKLIEVQGRDAAGNPVAGAEVIWTLSNRTDNPVYVVGHSGTTARILLRVLPRATLEVSGGVTDAEGKAYLIIDSGTAGDVIITVTVGGVSAKGYDGTDMRVVWF
jgi:hypothetical protein